MIDTHAHLDFSEFDPDRDTLVQQMLEQGISNAIIPGVAPALWQRQLAIARQYGFYYALGIHPWYCPLKNDVDISELKLLINSRRQDHALVAIGECGLDKLRQDTWPFQQAWLEAQLQLADELGLPVILHCVRAHEELLTLLSRHSPSRRGVIHGFYGSPELAARYFRLGYRLGIGGLLLNEDAKKLHLTVQHLPLDAFILETDSPAMAPKSAIDRRNTPLLIAQIVAKMANLQKKSSVLISERLSENAVQLFEL
ncbi:TatD family hydrolase [Shewanella cyperi]|uniref:TatD family hydrolase n=1 Tax=Shewanella cyperi TaxID=2814292 RepID=UPI001A951D1C|nr:TatD family hydrolase [Shewanella cyperi]QSX42546.1 TatD family hydrolase [Shewanella cyperi]